MTIVAPSFWLPPSMRPRSARTARWSKRLRDLKRWTQRLLHPLGLAADGDTMLDPDGDLVLDPTGDVELQDSTDCISCCPGCWDNAGVPSVNVALADFNYPTDWICYTQGCSEDLGYGTSCDPCAAEVYNFGSGSLDGTYDVPASSILACPGPLGGVGPGGHWRGYFPSPATWIFSASSVTPAQLVTPQFLLIDLTVCAQTGPPECNVTLQIFLVGCGDTDTSSLFLLTLFDGNTLVNPMPASLTLDNEIDSADAAWGSTDCGAHGRAGDWGGTAALTEGT